MKVSKGKVISNKDLEILLDRTDLLGEKMLFKCHFIMVAGVGTHAGLKRAKLIVIFGRTKCRYWANYTFYMLIFLKSG